MAVGSSGRLVIEIDAEVKKQLHEKIKKNGMNLKEWFESKVREDFPELYSDSDKDR